MATTIRNLIQDAMISIGAIGASETMENAEATFGLRQLNKMVDSWNIDKLWPYSHKTTTGTLTASDGEYTIGASADISTVFRPDAIISFAVTVGSVYYPLKQISRDEWMTRARETTSEGQPSIFCYSTDAPTTGTIYMYPIPDQAYAYTVTYRLHISEFALNDTLSLPAGYEGALESNLAVALAPRYGIAISPELKQEAIDRLARIKRQNEQPRILKTGLTRGRYDVFSDKVL